MKLEAKEKYKIEYGEVGNLRRHYSTIRSGLTTFTMTASLAAFATSLTDSATDRRCYLAFIGFFMLAVSAVVCLVFSYRSEKADSYMRLLWNWFGTEDSTGPSNYIDFKPNPRDVFRGMFHDEMNWVMVLGAALIAGAFCLSK